MYKDKEYEEWPIEKNLSVEGINFGKSGNGHTTTLVIKDSDGISEIQPYTKMISKNDVTYEYYPDIYLKFMSKDMVLINNKDADINIKGIKNRIVIENNILTLEKISDNVYYNNKKTAVKQIKLHENDELLINEIKIRYTKEYLYINGKKNNYETKLFEVNNKDNKFEGYPTYKRSPRLIKRLVEDNVEIINPPTKKPMKKSSLVQMIVPPIVMISITLLISIISPRGIYILMSLAGTSMSLIFSITKFYSEKKDIKESNKIRLEVYGKYLLKVRNKLKKMKENEIETLEYNYPTSKQIVKMIEESSSRLYDRTYIDEDFMCIMIGKRKDKAQYTIKTNTPEIQMDKDKLEEEINEIKEQYEYIENKPVILDLKKAHLGIVGEKKLIHQQIKLILTQVCYMQSYHDLEIIFLYDEQYKEEFEYLKWYPHFRISTINITGTIDTERKRDHVLGNLTQILKNRKINKDEDKKNTNYNPHYLFIIDEPKLIINHSIMEFMQAENSSLGYSIIYGTHMQANLPENIHTIVHLEDTKKAILVMNEKIVENKEIQLERCEEIDFERMARKLAPIKHQKEITSQIPESITFFEMYQIEHPSELKIKERWKKNANYKSLAVPIGVRGNKDYVYLNLHEKAHGPHGLIAGTTGSGKSEIVQTYILSLALNYHPYEVGFLLIDYKGGGMANLFRDLPHCLGTITNLDGSESMRAMASISSELDRRQEIFSKYSINHIDQYSKLFKQGKAVEPLPHLFIISDEFAELKKEQPDFMSELVSTARLGRSLGIHLILATQKPTGVVDDQIWSNSKFKLALKVQNESDSKEILKTNDAANITLPGRAYLQVGNNEIYELFQSAYSGTTYYKDSKDIVKDNRVYIMNDLGQGELINDDLSNLNDDLTIKETQLQAIIKEIKIIYDKESNIKVKKPWLETLSYNIINPNINNIIDTSNLKELDLTIPLGIVDIPTKQLQEEYNLNISKEGNLAIFSSSGYGKTTTLINIILSLVFKNSVNLLNFYILDFGNNALISLQELPHVCDYISFDNNEKLTKFIKLISEEINRRKKLFAKERYPNITVYNENVSNKLESIIIIIDNYDVVNDLPFEYESFLTKLSRDGLGLGIYMISSATRTAGIKYATLNNYKNRICCYMVDSGESSSLLGRSNYSVPEISGRALIKYDGINIIQLYSPIKFNNDTEFNNNLKTTISEFTKLYSGKRAKCIPVLPDVLNYELLDNYNINKSLKGNIKVALGCDEIEVCCLNDNVSSYLILGEAETGKTNLLRIIINQLNNNQVIILDSKNSDLNNYNNDNIIYHDSNYSIDTILDYLSNECFKRNNDYLLEFKKNKELSKKDYINSLPFIYIISDEVNEFIYKYNSSTISNKDDIINDLSEYGIKLIMTIRPSRFTTFDNITKFIKATNYKIVLGNINDQLLVPVTNFKEVNTEIDKGYLNYNNRTIRIQLPNIK
ncbi:MAG: type VII secretion protein EssC [Erysipelotrichaceae bacterium]